MGRYHRLVERHREGVRQAFGRGEILAPPHGPPRGPSGRLGRIPAQRDHGIATEVLVADLSRIEDVRRLAERLRSLDDIDILINNAGSSTVGPFAEADPEGQLAMLNVQMIGPRRSHPGGGPEHDPQERGLVVFTSSSSAFMPSPGSGVYIPAKAFLVSFARTLAPELEPAGVRVQALCPGYTHTEFHDDAAFDGLKAFLPRWVWGTSQERRRSIAAGSPERRGRRHSRASEPPDGPARPQASPAPVLYEKAMDGHRGARRPPEGPGLSPR